MRTHKQGKLNNIIKNEVAIKVIKNSSWLVSDKISKMIIGVFVTALVARYFGPENYGQFNYALSFTTLFTALSTLGLETLTVKAIVDEEYDEGTILCTSLVVRVFGGIILTILASIIIRLIEPNDSNLHALVLIMSLTMVFRSLEVIEYWIQAYQKAKISSIIRMLSYVITSGLRLALILLEGNLIHYGLIYMLDVIIIGMALLIAYFRNRDRASKWKINFYYAKYMLSQSWYLVLSGLMITLYMRIDQVMLGSMMTTKTELGVYSAAVQVAQMWYFVPMAIITSFKPVIMGKKRTNEKSYLKTVQLLYTVVAWMSIVFGIFIVLFSNVIIRILYGPAYLEAASVLSISVWAGTFAMIGTVTSTWLVCEGLHKYSVVFIFGGAITNISLNTVLIPRLGGYGAAIATVVTQLMSNIIMPLSIREVRLSFIIMLRSVLFFWKVRDTTTIEEMKNGALKKNSFV